MSGSKKVFTTLGSSNHVPEEREAFDYYATDPRAVEMLLELEQFSPVIWEPACGEGHISKVLQAHGYEVISTDLIYRGFGDPEPLDFLKETLDDFEGHGENRVGFPDSRVGKKSSCGAGSGVISTFESPYD